MTMWEYAVWAGLAVLIGEWNFRQPTNEEKLDIIFENIGYSSDKGKPSLIRKEEKPGYDEYVYNVPFGLIDDEKLHKVIPKTFNKLCRVYFDGKLHIRLYKGDLKKSYPYDTFEPKKGWKVPVGMSHDGAVYHDFDAIPHMTVAGATTWGKTVFMKMLMTNLIEQHPDDAEIYILDLKGGLAFHKYRNLKQVRIVADDYKTSEKALKMAQKAIKEDMKEYKAKGYENVKEAKVSKRRFIIIDEAGELMPNDSMDDDDEKAAKKCQSLLSYIARVTGQLGARMIFSTQYPTADIMDRQIKANSSAKVAFRLETATHSRVALDMEGAEKLPYPGRAIYKTVEPVIVQAPFISKKEIWERIGRYEDVTNREETPAPPENTIEIKHPSIRNKKTTPSD